MVVNVSKNNFVINNFNLVLINSLVTLKLSIKLITCNKKMELANSLPIILYIVRISGSIEVDGISDLTN